MRTGIIAICSNSSDTTPNDWKGGNSAQFNSKELWGKPADTLTKCTAGYGLVYVYQYDNYPGYFSKRC